jgi:hypothetical protein
MEILYSNSISFNSSGNSLSSSVYEAIISLTEFSKSIFASATVSPYPILV